MELMKIKDNESFQNANFEIKAKVVKLLKPFTVLIVPCKLFIVLLTVPIVPCKPFSVPLV
jgi:hypothetical protein